MDKKYKEDSKEIFAYYNRKNFKNNKNKPNFLSIFLEKKEQILPKMDQKNTKINPCV
jgi:hypothetical protein